MTGGAGSPPAATEADPSTAASDALAVLRWAGRHPIVRCFPQGAIIVFDTDLRYLSAGGLGLADVGLSREMLEGNTIFEVFPPEVVAVIEPLYRQALAGHHSAIDVPYEGRIYLQRLGPLLDDAGGIVAGMGFTQDITAARRAERELRESETRFRLAFANTLIASAVVGLDGRYQQVNPAMCEFVGYSPEQLLTMAPADITHPDDRASHLEMISRLAAGEHFSDTADKRYLTSAGNVVWGTRTLSVVRREDGSPLHVTVQIQDITERKNHEQVLLDERRRLIEAESIGRVGSWELDLETQAVSWSSGLFVLYGVDPDCFDGDYSAALRCLHPDDVEAVSTAVDACARSGQPLRVRYRVIRLNDSELRWMDARGEARYLDGQIRRIGGSVTDVTDSVQAGLAAAAAQAFQQAVFTASPDIIAVWDFASRTIVWANHSITDALGYSGAEAEQMAGELAGHLIPDEDRAEFDAATAAAQDASDDGLIHVDYRMRHRDGSIRWFARRTAPLLRDRDGRVTQIVGVIRDTTDAKAVEAALRESQALFHQLAESVDVGFVIRRWDPPEFLYVSPGCARILGGDLLTQTPEESMQRIHPDDRARFLRQSWSPSQTGLATTTEYRIVRPDGQVRWLRSKTTPVPGLGSERPRSASTVEDITVSRQAEQAIISAAAADKANAAKSEFLSRMSHELRTPLNAVLGFAQLLDLDPLTDEQKDALRHILHGGRHLLGLIDDVLDISKMDSDRLEVNIRPVAIADLLDQTIALLMPQAQQAGVSVHRHRGSDWCVLADERRLRQVVINLLSNAIKYTRPGGRVDISCVADDGSALRILVTDTGCGIHEPDLPRLFTPFDRLGVQSAGIEGAGIGLALSHRLMNRMGGGLAATSTAGEGSTFTVTIPMSPAPLIEPHTVGHETAPPTPPAETHRLTVLYIEDNPSNIELMSRLVDRRPQWRLMVAENGSQGLALAGSAAPDLILLDLNLPDLHGSEILERLRSDPRTGSLPVVVVSADASLLQVDRLLVAGAQAYLTKPLDLRKVLELLDSHGPDGSQGR